MKENIHPDYRNATIECACGNLIETRSTRGNYKIDVCSGCHPFFTGKMKYVDSAGRIEKFQKKYGRFIKKDEKSETQEASVPQSI